MNKIDFYDLMTVDPLMWGTEIDPIGLLTYQNHKRKKIGMVEEVIDEATKLTPAQMRMKSADAERVQYGAMKRDDYEKKWKVGKYRPKGNPLHGPGGLYKNLVKDSVEETNEERLDEVLTLQQRMRRKILMRRLAPRIARARKIAMRRRAGLDVLKRRALALARRTMAKKLLGGRNKADVSTSERARIEKILAKRKKGIERLATRLLPNVRKAQSMRFAAKNKKAAEPAKKPATPAPASSSNK